MSVPFLGEPMGEWQAGLCGHASSPTNAIHCNRDATWHGFAVDGDDIKAMTGCCDEHLPAMKLAVDYVHPLVHPCGIPGSLFRWPENECYTEWSEQSEFAQLMTAGTP